MDSSQATPAVPEVATLLGARGLDASIVCLESLQRNSVHPVRLRLHDDGTLSAADLARLASALDLSRVVSRAEADSEANRRLAKLPASRRLRSENVLALKLFDVVWFEETDIVRYVDSDVLFLRPFSGPPALASATTARFFPDSQSAYSMRFWDLLGPGRVRLPARLNTGLFTINKSDLDFERVERFLAAWRGFAPVWIEQTCWALLADGDGTELLDSAQFRIHDPASPVGPEVVALHFVSSVRGDLARIAAQHPDAAGAPVVDVGTHPANPLGSATVLREALSRKFLRPSGW